MGGAPFRGFIGGAYAAESARANAQTCTNLMPVPDTSGSGVNALNYVSAPGKSVFTTLPTYPVRVVFAAGSPLNGAARLFAVGGSKLYEVGSGGAVTLLGDVGDDATHTPARMAVNGNQLAVWSAGKVKVDNGAGPVQATYTAISGTCDTSGVDVTWKTGTQFDPSMVGRPITITAVVYTVASWTSKTQITLTGSAGAQTAAVWSAAGGDVEGVTGGFLGSYFFSQIPNSKIFVISNNNNGLDWDGIDFAVKEGYPDNIGSTLADHQQLWLFGEETIEPWQNTGNSDFPFERDAGTVIQMGISAPWSATSVDNGVAWLGNNTKGSAAAYYAQGFTPAQVSTPALEAEWAGYSSVIDAIGWAETRNGRRLWVLTFPTANKTWVYDTGLKLWHQRGRWNGTTFDRCRARCHTWVFGKHLVGDHTTGAIYDMSSSVYQDNGTAIRRVRSAPHLSSAESWFALNRFRLSLENTGSLSPSFDFSVDGGKTFGTARTATAAVGAYSLYEWRRLGRMRDFVPRITISDNLPVRIVDAYWE